MVAAILVGAISAAQAAAAASARAGRDLFMRTCIACHVTDNASTASDHAPPLSAIARANKERPDTIRAWLTNPHPPMPNLMLSRQQMSDIIAYLNSIPVS